MSSPRGAASTVAKSVGPPPAADGRRPALRLSVRFKLILCSTLVILVASSGFTWVNLVLARRAIEEDLQNRAIVYAREVATAIGGRRELESGPALQQLIARLLEIRRSVIQLDVLALEREGATVVATNIPNLPLPFSARDADDVLAGPGVYRALATGAGQHGEVVAPNTRAGAGAGAVAV
jgi:hypothetical protein